MTDILNEPVPLKVVIGIVIALLGMVLYLFLKSSEAKRTIRNTDKKSTSRTDPFIHSDLHAWLENSKNALLQLGTLLPNEIKVLKGEIEKRQQLFDNYTIEPINANSKIEKLQGTYHIIGFNQNEEKSRYSGFLHLKKTGDHRVHAEWVIDGEQTQIGTGFFNNNNNLVINFSYEGLGNKLYKGVVVYKLLNESILTGFWSEKHASDEWLGIEECRKLANSEIIYNIAKLN